MNDNYKQGFQDEAREMLAELESSLLELDRDRNNSELVARAFRALHTIKGTGAMFGFDEIAGFTHNLETAFDQLRNGRIQATSELINLTLAAADQIKAMLERAAGNGSVDEGRTAEILERLFQLTGPGRDDRPSAPPPSSPRPVIEERSPAVWQIQFRPRPDVLANGTNPLLLLRELRGLGQLQVKIDTSALPPLAEIAPDCCYLGWDMILRTAASADAIRDVFIFVEDSCDLTITPAPAEVEQPAIAENRPGSPSPRSASSRAPASSVRVSAEKLDQLVNLVGELVTLQARLGAVANRLDHPDVLAISEDADRLTAELRDASMSLRMLPLRSSFERCRRLVHDLGSELHKQVDLVIEGADTELDKTVIDQLNDPLVHLIRNSMDHGIETPEQRRAAGKNPTATIRLSAVHSGASVLIQVSDDGRGLDVKAVHERAVEKGLIDASAALSSDQILALILEPGFSTARKVTDLSGRGVGMDVVRRSVDALHGSIEIGNRPGEGLTIILRLPLTMAIIDGLLVRVDNVHFILPLASSLECAPLTAQDIRNANGNRIAHVRGELVPYVRLREHFGMGTGRPDVEQIMVVETELGRYGLVVDEVLGDHQTVVKSLGKLYRDVPAISGATILGDGAVALIVDPPRLIQNVVHDMSSSKSLSSRKAGATACPEQTRSSVSIRKENYSYVT